MRVIGHIILLIDLLFVTGCASIVSKSNYRLRVASSEDNVLVKIYSEGEQKPLMNVRAPTTITLSAGDGMFVPAKYKFVFTKEGFKDSEVHIKAEFDPWYLGNIGFGGLIGALIVDPLTGAMWMFDEKKSVYASLERIANYRDDFTLQAIHELHDNGNLSDDEFNRLNTHLHENKQKQRER